MNIVPVFVSLVIGHLLADFPLQTDTVYRWRQKGWPGVAFHAGIHVAVAAALIHGLLLRWWLLLALGLCHAGIDRAKPYIPLSRPWAKFLTDQALHVTSLGVIAWLARDLSPIVSGPLMYGLLGLAFVPAALRFVETLRNGSIFLGGVFARGRKRGDVSAIYHITGWLPIVLVLLTLVH